MTAPAWAASIPGPGDPLPAQIEAFLEYLEVQLNRPVTTVRTYRGDLAKFVAFCRTAGLDEDDRGLLGRYQIELAAVVPNPRSRARVLSAVRGFLRWAYREEVYPGDYSSHITPPRFVVGDPHPLRSTAVSQLLNALPRGTLHELRDRALVAFLMSTGCRVSEAISVNRDEVRPEGFRVLGKGGKRRTVYLTGEAWGAVREYLEARGADDGEPALWVNFWRPATATARGLVHSRRLGADGVRAVWRDLQRRIPLMADLRSPHAARHTAATTLLEATGGDVRLVQEVLGHATLETLRVYTEITDARKRAAYQRLGDYLRSLAPEPGVWAALAAGNT